jgi:glycosyltransferase involved in cell wall biosynthesis
MRGCLDRVQEYLEEKNIDYEIILAEDGSTDRTVEIAREYTNYNSKIKLNSSTIRLGKGGSILQGILRATKSNILYIDVDLSSDISEIERLVGYIDTYDIVVGSRFIRGDLGDIQRPLSRTLFSICYSFICKALFRSNIKDYQCGLKLLKNNPSLIHDVIPNIKIKKFAFDTDLIVKSLNQGLRIKEVAVLWQHKEGSKINVPKQAWYMGKDLLKIWMDIHLNSNRIKSIGKISQPLPA